MGSKMSLFDFPLLMSPTTFVSACCCVIMTPMNAAICGSGVLGRAGLALRAAGVGAGAAGDPCCPGWEEELPVPTQFKSTQLVVAIAAWANAISARGARPDLSILLPNNASEQCYIIVG